MKKKTKPGRGGPKPVCITSDGLPVWCHYDELCNPADLPDYPGNPNTHGEAQCERIVGIIKANGWREAITRSRLTGRITKGHGRKLAALLAALGQVPVVWQDYASEEDERRDVIADNRAREGSRMDNEALAAMVGRIADNTGCGFTDGELAALSKPPSPGTTDNFNYVSQFGVIVICDGEQSQKAAYEKLSGEGYNCKVVVT